MVAENIVVIRKLSSYSARPIFFAAFVLTARRYNLVGVTRRKHRAGSRYFSQKAVMVQGGYGAVFAIQVQSLWSITRVAVQSFSEQRIYHWLQSWWRALVQCRGKKLIEARKLSRYIEF